MATLTALSDASDGFIICDSTVYATAAAGGGAGANTAFTGEALAGQSLSGGTYYLMEGFLAFDTSVIAGGTVTAVTLELYGKADHSTTNFTLQCAPYDWGATLTTGDWQTPSQLNALTPVASYSVTAMPTGAYTTIPNVSDALMIAAINPAGFTRFIFYGSKQAAGGTGTAPTNDEFIDIWYGDDATRQPKLTVTYTPAADATSFDPMGRQGRYGI